VGTQPRRQRLTRERILRAAAELVERDGLAALSMRSLAGKVGVEAMSLYNHIADKADVLDGVAELVLYDMEIPERTDDSFADVRALAFAFREAALAHPNAFPLLVSRQLRAPGALRYTEAALSVLTDCGLDVRSAVRMLRAFLAIQTGSLIREVGAPLSFTGEDVAGMRERIGQLSASEYPAVRSAAELLATTDREVEYAFGVDTLISAIRVMCEGKPRQPART